MKNFPYICINENIVYNKMSKKIKISIPNKVKPNLINLFHEYIVRKAKEPTPRRGLGGNGEQYLWDCDEYDDMAEYWDRMFPGWDDDIDEADIVYPLHEARTIVVNPKGRKGKKRDVYRDFWNQEAREEQWNSKGKKKHKKGKNARIIGINTPYSGFEGEDDDEYDFSGINLDFTTDDYDDGYKQIWFYPDYHEKNDKLEFNSLKEFSDYCESMGYLVSKEVMNDISWRYESHCCLCPESEKAGLLEIMCEHSYGEMFYEACEEYELSEQ